MQLSFFEYCWKYCNYMNTVSAFQQKRHNHAAYKVSNWLDISLTISSVSIRCTYHVWFVISINNRDHLFLFEWMKLDKDNSSAASVVFTRYCVLFKVSLKEGKITFIHVKFLYEMVF